MSEESRDQLIGRNLAAHRGVTSQQALADAMRERGHKWSQSTVWSIERGDRPLRLSEAADIREILGIDPLLLLIDLDRGPEYDLIAAAQKVHDVLARLTAALSQSIDELARFEDAYNSSLDHTDESATEPTRGVRLLARRVAVAHMEGAVPQGALRELAEPVRVIVESIEEIQSHLQEEVAEDDVDGGTSEVDAVDMLTWLKDDVEKQRAAEVTMRSARTGRYVSKPGRSDRSIKSRDKKVTDGEHQEAP